VRCTPDPVAGSVATSINSTVCGLIIPKPPSGW
jgi:hypothetical protein